MNRGIPWTGLKALPRGELETEGAALAAHAEDASMFRAEPDAVAFPSDATDLAAILAFCREHAVPIRAWGAGTSRGGQPLGAGLVVNFRRHMNRILGFDERTGELRVEPGAYYGEVQKFLRPKGRSFPPDPSWHQCTIAGMIANNAAGIHSVKYGGTTEHVARLAFLTADGVSHDTDVPDALAARVAELLRGHAARIASGYPKVEKNSAGYALDRALRADGSVDLSRLLTGSEGTLALITEARLRTVPVPGSAALAIYYFASLEKALEGALTLKACGVAACELVDKLLLDLHESAGRTPGSPKHARKITGNAFLDRFYELGAEAVLIVETDGATSPEAQAGADRAAEALAPFALRGERAGSEEEAALVWDLRRHTSPILNRLENGKITIKPLWAVEDPSLPRATFLEYVREQKALFARFGLTCSFFGHAASCNLHIDPLAVDPRRARVDADLARLYEDVAKESYELVVRLGGSISGEHGDGLSRTPFLPLQYPTVYPLFRELKRLFDPQGILNPGKIADA